MSQHWHPIGQCGPCVALITEFVFVFTVTPLDVVKIRLQAQQTPFHQGRTFCLFLFSVALN